MNSILLFISGPEIMVIMLIVVMVFGADKIPEIARGLGKGMRQVKDATNDIKKEIKDKDTKILLEYNKLLNTDARIETVLLPIRDGLTISRVK